MPQIVQSNRFLSENKFQRVLWKKTLTDRNISSKGNTFSKEDVIK